MATKTKKIRYAGRYGARYGARVRKRLNKVEEKQRKKQKCPFCKKAGVKRKSAGIWNCPKCGKTFTSKAYYLQ